MKTFLNDLKTLLSLDLPNQYRVVVKKTHSLIVSQVTPIPSIYSTIILYDFKLQISIYFVFVFKYFVETLKSSLKYFQRLLKMSDLINWKMMHITYWQTNALLQLFPKCHPEIYLLFSGNMILLIALKLALMLNVIL